MYDIGVIHGRFQVLHNDHVRYLLSGKALCRQLVVGITNPEPLLTKAETADPNRSDAMANPLTYYERYTMVRQALTAEDIAPHLYSIVPLPINIPERYRHYVPLDAVFFLTIYDRWGERKHHYFKSLGLKTHILRNVTADQKGLSASDIRKRMAAGEPWEHLVPPSVARMVKILNLPSRLKHLRRETLQARA